MGKVPGMLEAGLAKEVSLDKGLFCRMTGFRFGVNGIVGGLEGSLGGGIGGEADAGAGIEVRLESESVDGGRGGRWIDEEDNRRALWMELAPKEDRRSEAIAKRSVRGCNAGGGR